jgi:hypothetical protein
VNGRDNKPGHDERESHHLTLLVLLASRPRQLARDTGVECPTLVTATNPAPSVSPSASLGITLTPTSTAHRAEILVHLAAAEAIGIVLAENMPTAATVIKPVLSMMGVLPEGMHPGKLRDGCKEGDAQFKIALGR